MVKNNPRILVVGLGSIGYRHINNLRRLGHTDISVYRTFKNLKNYKLPKNIKILKKYNQDSLKKFDYVILSNPTSEHVKYAINSIKNGINTYIEKPLSNNLKNTNLLSKLTKSKKVKVLVGCQLRYHPHLILIKDYMKRKRLGKIYSVNCDVGQRLSDWHPSENFKDSYASKEELGGGVILTLIHEIDYLHWLFGKFKSVYSIGGKLTKLKINSEDTVLSCFKTINNVPISLRTDYWRKPPTRTLNIVGEKGEIFWDYFQNKLSILNDKGKLILKRKMAPRNDYLYLKIMKDFITKKKVKISLKQGIYALEVALAMKKSIKFSKKILIN